MAYWGIVCCMERRVSQWMHDVFWALKYFLRAQQLSQLSKLTTISNIFIIVDLASIIKKFFINHCNSHLSIAWISVLNWFQTICFFFGLRQCDTNTRFYLVNWCTDNCSLIRSAFEVRAFHNIWDNDDNYIWDFIWNAFVAFFFVLYTCFNSCVLN